MPPIYLLLAEGHSRPSRIHSFSTILYLRDFTRGQWDALAWASARSGLGKRTLWPGQAHARLALDRPRLGRNLAVGSPPDFTETSFGQAALYGGPRRTAARRQPRSNRAPASRGGFAPCAHWALLRGLVCVGARGSIAHRYGCFGADLLVGAFRQGVAAPCRSSVQLIHWCSPMIDR